MLLSSGDDVTAGRRRLRYANRADLAALPFKATGKVVDWTTTSPSEADRNYAQQVAYERAQDRHMADRHCRAFPEDCAY